MDPGPKLRRPTAVIATNNTTQSTASGTLFAPTSRPCLLHSQRKQPVGLMSLPNELHITISRHLTYPDALALKHSSRHFYSFVDTGIKLKVAWLLHRRQLLLSGPPHDASCDLRSDSGFCSGNVSKLIRQRRQHIECESRPDLGCIVFDTASCTRRPDLWQRWKLKLRSKVAVELWLLSLVVVPLICSLVWIIDLAGSGRTERGAAVVQHEA